MILHEAKLRPSVNIKDILIMQVGLNCLLSHKGIRVAGIQGKRKREREWKAAMGTCKN